MTIDRPRRHQLLVDWGWIRIGANGSGYAVEDAHHFGAGATTAGLLDGHLDRVDEHCLVPVGLVHVEVPAQVGATKGADTKATMSDSRDTTDADAPPGNLECTFSSRRTFCCKASVQGSPRRRSRSRSCPGLAAAVTRPASRCTAAVCPAAARAAQSFRLSVQRGWRCCCMLAGMRRCDVRRASRSRTRRR